MKNRVALIVSAVLAASVTGAFGASGPDDDFQFFKEESQVVTASRAPQARSQAPATVYVVTSDDIRDSGARTIWDALRNVPGVDVVQTRTGQAEVSIRGLDQAFNNRTLVLLDGRTVLNGNYDFVTWESLPVTLEEIDRIEIVEGPASALYGANAITGVINIITKTPEQLNGGQATYTSGERAWQQGSVMVGRKASKTWSYRAGGGWDSTNQFQRADQFASDAGKFNSQISYTPNDDSEWNVAGGVTRLNTQTSVGSSGAAYDKGLVSFTRTDYRYKDTKLRAFWNHGRTELNEFQFPPNSEDDYDTFDGQAEQAITLPFRQRLSLGAEYRHNNARSNAFAGTSVQQDLWALFAEDQWTLIDHWALTASARMDRHPFTPLTVSPRASLVYTPVPDQTFRVSAGTAFRMPTLTENYVDLHLDTPIDAPPNTDVNTHIAGNRDLDPERIRTVEIAHSAQWGRLKTSLVGFHYVLNHLIESNAPETVGDVPPTVFAQSSFINTGSVSAWGGEAGVECAFSSWLSGFGNYSYQNLRLDTISNIASGQSPRRKANVGIRAKKEGWTGNLALNWVDRTAWELTSISGPTGSVNAYFLLSGHIGYAFRGAWQGWAVGLNAFNLLNHDHYEILPPQGINPGQNGEIIRQRLTATVSYAFQ